MAVLETAIETAQKRDIPTIIIASTTGNTASRVFNLVKKEKLRMIVVTHDERRCPQERRFNEDIRRMLLSNDVTVYTHNPRIILLRKVLGRFGLSPWYRHLGNIKARYGTGIKVCHIITKMLIEGRVLQDGKVVTIAGTRSGADSVVIFSVRPKNKWPILEEVVVCRGNLLYGNSKNFTTEATEITKIKNLSSSVTSSYLHKLWLH